jgi:beta-galactosidase
MWLSFAPSDHVRRFRSHRTVAAALVVGLVAVVGLTQVFVRLTAGSPSSSPGAPVVTPDTGERQIDFDSGWKFMLVNPNDTADPTGVYGNAAVPKASAADFDDSRWRSVTLPHDWSIELAPQPKGVSNATGYFEGGLGWYRKTFTLPASIAGKSIGLVFDGIYRDSWLYLNGARIGNHAYG